ncbi:MAG: cytochrome-c peroxidase [Myxococcota bacterium]
MRLSRLTLTHTAALLACVAAACVPTPRPNEASQGTDPSAAPVTTAALNKTLTEAFQPLPTSLVDAKRPPSAAQIELGRMLYFESRLSKSQDLSCSSCHRLNRFGVDNKPTSLGANGVALARNAPSIYNAGLHVAQGWDGRFPDLEAQTRAHLLDPLVMAQSDAADVVASVQSIPGYPPLFAAAFPHSAEPVSVDTIALSIGAFERTLLTPSPLDDYLHGDVSALSPAEIAGATLFVEAGCTTCHTGPTLGGTTHKKLGVVEAYETDDLGRFSHTGIEADRHVFKVPSLRNVAHTAPYFHDGSVRGLPTAVKLMAKHQLGKEMSDNDARTISIFLEALNGRIDVEHTKRPKLPEG